MVNVDSRALLAACLLTLLTLPACSVNVKKGENGEDKKVDIETPVGGIHVDTNANAKDTGLPVYPGARLKEKKENGEEKSANVNISSGLFGVKVVALEYVSNDPSTKLVDYYRNQLKKYGDVLECHTSHEGGGNFVAHRGGEDSKKLKCDDDDDGKVVELKVGTNQNQHIVSIQPADSGKGSDFALVLVQTRGGKDTI
ncbi:MAG: hypothetical protein DMG88_04715 [Acidobacteria bacterium]|nr:MAG: hypothetical protein DMG88_04715 [Acidobacteriota bacterium]